MQRRHRIITLLSATALLLGVFAAPGSASARSRTHFVNDGYSNGTNSGCNNPEYGVNSYANGGAAIADAVSDALPGDRIFICAGNYYFTDDIYIGGGTVRQNLTITGEGYSTVLYANDNSRFFDVNYGGTVTISDLWMENGNDSNGGAICHNGGDLVVRRVMFWSNYSSAHGGAIACSGRSLKVLNSEFFYNTGWYHGGAIDVHQDNGTIISNSYFFGNYSYDEGGALGANGSALSVTGSTFDSNFAENEGGAIWWDGGVLKLKINGNIFANNGTYTWGDAIALLCSGFDQYYQIVNKNKFYNDSVETGC